jgi:hypothetical protein
MESGRHAHSIRIGRNKVLRRGFKLALMERDFGTDLAITSSCNALFVNISEKISMSVRKTATGATSLTCSSIETLDK